MLDQKEILGPQKFWVQNKCVSIEKNLSTEKDCGPKKICSKKILGPQIHFWPKNLGPKKFGSQKI